MRIFTYVFLVLVASVIVGCLKGEQTSAEPTIWQNKQVIKIAEGPSQGLPYAASSCSGILNLIEVEQRDGFVSACIFGQHDKFRLARYQHSNGHFGYAAAYPSDTKFTPVRNFCTGVEWCVYGQSEDTLLLNMSIGVRHWGQVFIKDFSKYLKLNTDTHRYYTFEYIGDYHYLGAEGIPYATEAVAMSPSGRWALVELPSYGFVRVDMRTLETRRIIAPGATYGLANDPSFEMAITDDGQKVAVTGWRSGITVVEVTPNCGDVLTPVSGENFAVYISPCPEALIDRYALFPNFSFGQFPRFSHDGSTLSLYVNTTYGQTFARLSSQQSSSSIPHYAAYGDSFTSGEGETDGTFYVEGTDTSTNTCHVSTRSYPFILQKQWEGTASNHACSGSRIEDVRKTLRVGSNTALTLRPTILSLGIGGNDVGLMSKLKTCLQPGTCEWVKPERRIATANEIKRLLQPLITLIQEMQQDNAGSPVFVVGYPEIINGTSNAACDALISSLLSREERVYMNESVRYLNTVIRAAARYTNARFIDIERAFEGERLCDQSSKAMNALRSGDDIAPVPFIQTKFIGAESFHPTPFGHTLIARDTEAQLSEGFWDTASCGSCSFDAQQLEPSEYWREVIQAEWLEVRQLTAEFIKSSMLMSGGVIDISFPENTFKPGSEVKFELHSTVIELGEDTVAPNGSLSGKLTLPSNTTGHHTIHALGVSASGDRMDIYQVVYIGETSKHSGHDGVPSGLSTLSTGADSGASSKPEGAMVAVESPSGHEASAITIPKILGVSQVPAKKVTNKTFQDPPLLQLQPGFIVTYLILAGVSIGALALLYWLLRRNAPK